jgi:hypothetical protein
VRLAKLLTSQLKSLASRLSCGMAVPTLGRGWPRLSRS